MPARVAPLWLLSAAVTASLVLAAVMLGLAMDQRWLGLRLVAAPNLVTTVDAGAPWIDRIVPGGPVDAALAPDDPEPYAALTAIGPPGGPMLRLVPGDLLEEPDTLATYAEIDAFKARQDQIAAILRGPRVDLEITPYLGMPLIVEVDPARQRPPGSLPLTFWIQIGVGLVGFWIGAWVWILRRGDWAARCLGLSGAGLMVSAFAAAVYSTRELAMPAPLFTALSGFNHAGALAFGVGMIGLFMIYPRRLAGNRWLLLPALVLGGWLAVGQLRLAEGPPLGFHLGVTLAMLTIVVLVLVQVRRTRGDPLERAALRWLGLSVAVGAGAFVVSIIAPNLLGLPPALPQGVAFLFFLVIYVGVALGVARFRLFRLDDWAFGILFYVVGALLLLAIDAVLILTIVDERAPAFALSLVIIALAWLPLREALARRLLRRREPDRDKLFRAVLDVALTPPGADQAARWRGLLEGVFRPLSATPAPALAATALRENGVALEVPGVAGLPGYRLTYAEAGRRLFSLRDRELAADLQAMLGYALDSRRAYEQGATEERDRIARDIHDNIGIQLMGALHSREADRKDVLIRETLTDLRDIVNNASSPELSFDELLADLRLQMSERLDAAGVEMDWIAEAAGPAVLPLPAAHTLRSIIREAVRNALRHARPGRVAIAVRLAGGQLSVAVSDDGAGFDPASVRPGNGLSNMQSRAESLGGRFAIDPAPGGGTRITATFPVTPRRSPA